MTERMDDQLEPQARGRAGFRMPLPGPQRVMPGVDLVHLADRDDVRVGETITFTAWLLNSSDEVLTDICLGPRPRADGSLDGLDYVAAPAAAELSGRTLAPGRSLNFTMKYVAKPADAEAGGLLVSGLRLELSSPSRGRLAVEADAFAQVFI